MMTQRRHGIGAPALLGAIVAACVTSAAPARGEDVAAAKELFRQATEAARRDDHRAAARLYEEADRKAPRANAVFNAGEQWDAAGDPLRAADAFATAILRGGLDARVVEGAEKRLRDLEQGIEASVGAIQVTGPAGALVTVAHARRVPVPARVHVSPGEVVVTLELPTGSVSKRTVTVQAGRTAYLSADEAPPKTGSTAGALPKTGSPAGAPGAPLAPIVPPQVEPRGVSWRRPLGWASMAAGATTVGVGIGLGVRGLSVRDEWDAVGHDPSRMDLHDQAVSLRTWANVAIAGGVGLGAVGVLLVVLSPNREIGAQQGGRTAELRVLPSRITLDVSF